MDGETKIESGERETLDVSTLVRFPMNPRHVRDDDPKVIALAEDMKRRGQITDIIVRTVDDGDSWEVLAGNRRLVAARLAELTTLRAIIRRDLDQDDDALELCLAEQLQHEDLAPLEEADSLAQLLRTMPRGTSIAQLASRVGRAESGVRRSLALRNVADAVRAISPSIDLGALHALASLSDVAQERIAKRLVKVLEQEPRITRSIVSRIIDQENVTRSLRTVTWKLDDAELVPAAGACNVCPKRTGQGSLVDDVVAADDVCLDDACYSDKGAASQERALEQARAAGAKVLSKKEGERVLDHGRPKHDSDYVHEDERVTIGDKQVPVRNLLGAREGVKPVAIPDAETNGVTRAFMRRDVDAAVKEAKATAAARAKKKATAPADPKRAQAAASEKAKEALRERVTALALRRAYDYALGDGAKSTCAGLLRLIDDADPGELPPILERRGVTSSAKWSERAGQLTKLARPIAAKGDIAALVGILCEIAAARHLPHNHYAGDPDAVKAWGIDLPKITKEAESQLAAESASRTKAAAAPAKKGSKR